MKHLSNKRSHKLLTELHKKVIPIYTIQLILAKDRPALLVGVTEMIDEALYNRIKSSLTTTKRTGKIELGGLADDLGLSFRISCDSEASLEQGIYDLLDLGREAIRHGVSEDKVLNPRPRPELLESLAKVRGLISNDFPVNKAIQSLKGGCEFIGQAVKEDPAYAKIINNTRLVPKGYSVDTF